MAACRPPLASIERALDAAGLGLLARQVLVPDHQRDWSTVRHLRILVFHRLAIACALLPSIERGAHLLSL